MKLKTYNADVKTITMSEKDHKLFNAFLTESDITFETMDIMPTKKIYYMDHTIDNIEEEFITFKLIHG